MRVFTTLLPPDAGEVSVLGHDVTREPGLVRRLIGLSGQYSAVDENLTGRENLWMFGKLYGLSSQESRNRADDLFGNPRPFASDGFPAQYPILLSVLYIAAVVAIFAPPAVRKYAHATGR